MTFMGHEVSARLFGSFLLVLSGLLMAYSLKSGEFVLPSWLDNISRRSDPFGYWTGVACLAFFVAAGAWLIYTNHF